MSASEAQRKRPRFRTKLARLQASRAKRLGKNHLDLRFRLFIPPQSTSIIDPVYPLSSRISDFIKPLYFAKIKENIEVHITKNEH